MAKKQRDPFFDNAKLLLIFFVVLGHYLNDFRESPEIAYSIYNFIYLFHIPGFVFISGYFSQHHARPGHLSDLATRMLLPFLSFHIAYHVFYHFHVGDPLFPLRIYDPHWTLWFLVSLLSWYALLRPLMKLRHPFWVSLAAGLAIGVVDFVGCNFSLCRTFVFLPFFVLGHLAGKGELASLRLKNAKWWGALGLLGVFVATHFLLPTGVENWLFGSYSYATMDTGRLLGVAIRAGVYGLSFLTTACFLAVVPKKRRFFTEWGSRTLYVFLLHGFLVQSLVAVPALREWIFDGHYWIVLALSLVTTAVLATRPVAWLTRPVVELERGGSFPLESFLPHKIWSHLRKAGRDEEGWGGETRHYPV